MSLTLEFHAISLKIQNIPNQRIPVIARQKGRILVIASPKVKIPVIASPKDEAIYILYNPATASSPSAKTAPPTKENTAIPR